MIRGVEGVGVNDRVTSSISRDRLGDYAKKTYRDLRLGIVAVIVLLAASVLIEIAQTSPTCVLPSISAYYYTPVQEVFVAALVAIGMCMIAIEAPNEWENLLLNVAGMLTPVVAMVPEPVAYHCWSGTATPQDAVPKIVNNVWALFLTGVLGIVVYLVVIAVRYRRTDPAHRPGIRSLRAPHLAGFAAALVILVGGIGWLQLDRTGFVNYAHYTAAIPLFVAFFGVTALNAWTVGDQDGSNLRSTRRWLNRYSVIAAMMLLATLVLGPLTWVGHWYHGPLVIEAALIALFAAFWLLQTVELWHAGLRPEPTRPSWG